MEFKVMAPEFKGIKAWLNSKPLSMERLKGKVVLIEFWAYSCINCRRTLPYLKRWHERYSKEGLTIIGIHSPEFAFERKAANVRKAVKELGIGYPVAMDNDMVMWEAYDNRCWPARFLIEDGCVTYVHFGEGDYERTEMAIQEALGISAKPEKERYPGYMFDQSPETYAGFERNQGLGSGLVCINNECDAYVDPEEHEPNVIYPDGFWDQKAECLELQKAPGKLSYRFTARQVNLVLEPVGKKSKADVFIDKRKRKSVTIDHPGMYSIYDEKGYMERELSIVFHGKVRAYVFTFG